jgi:hypothetical protein
MKRIGILYDRLRWYEKTIIQAATKKGVEIAKIDAKDLALDITCAPSFSRIAVRYNPR